MVGSDSPGESRHVHLSSAPTVVGRVRFAETELASEGPDVRPFTQFRDNDFYADAMQVEEWAVLNDGEFVQATSALTLKSLRVGIDQATEVAHHLAERLARAEQLAGRLREAARSASDHGLTKPSEF